MNTENKMPTVFNYYIINFNLLFLYIINILFSSAMRHKSLMASMAIDRNDRQEKNAQGKFQKVLQYFGNFRNFFEFF